MNTSTNIKAMILAAGRGERMRPLTDSRPKPLLRVRGKPLIDWHAQALARGGFNALVINTAWLGEHILSHFPPQPTQDGREQLSISYSHEGADFGAALETAGGIARALPLLGKVFWVLAGDVFVPDFEFSQDAVSRFVAGPRRFWTESCRLGAESASRRHRPTLHLQHDRPVPAGLFQRAALWQSARPQGPAGTAVAGGDGQSMRQRRTV
jgi:hypothetical protein